jgi:hypothetical protein
MLLTAGADGSVAVWDPSRSATKGPDREIAPKHSFKAHDSAVHAMTYFLTYTEKPDPPVLRLATAGAFQLSAGVGGWAQQRAEAFGPPLQPEAAL